jgi:MscS family membrane protein
MHWRHSPPDPLPHETTKDRGVLGSADPGTGLIAAARRRGGLGAGVRAVLGAALALATATAAPQPVEPGQLPAPRAPSSMASEAARPASSPAISYHLPSSPRAALALYFEAVRKGHWEDAARYLVLDEHQQPRGPQLARRLKGVIDGNRWIDLDTVSADPQGRRDDGLPADLDEVDRIVVGGRSESLRMTRVPDAQGGHWAFSAATVEHIDGWYEQLPDRWVRDAIVYSGLDAWLLRPGPFELLWWQWTAIPLLALAALGVGSLLGRLTRRLLGRITTRTATLWDDKAIARIGPPLGLFWALNLFWFGSRSLILTDPAFRALESFATAGMVFTLFWALWRSSGSIVEQMLQRPWAVRSPSARTLVTVGGNFARSAIFCIGGLAVLAAAGYPVGTLLAGLGIGGLAIAFGAQKTIENIFGSLSLVVDQPFRVGDFVRVDDFVATVEDIGLRSTRFRTLDRTLVTIPNGKLADQRLESYEARDRMRLATTIGIEYGASAQQVQTVLSGMERVLRDHPKIWPDAVVVKFSQFGSSSLDIEVMAWFQVPTWGEFQRCREEVLLGFMRVVEGAGTAFAFPTRTVHLVSRTPA